MRTACLVLFGCLVACSSSADTGGATTGTPQGVDATAACGAIVDSTCATLVRCKVYTDPTDPTSPVWTSSACQTARAMLVTDCTNKNASMLATASQTDVEACVNAFQSLACTSICGQVPMDPSACQKVEVQSTDMTTVQCAP